MHSFNHFFKDVKNFIVSFSVITEEAVDEFCVLLVAATMARGLEKRLYTLIIYTH